MSKKIAIGGDHAGFHFKSDLLDELKKQGYEVKDFGPSSDSSVDYPDFAHPLSLAVGAKEVDFGILICGSGQGMAITANKHKNVRAALCWNEEIVKLSRQHNNANVLCLPARFISMEDAKKFILTFIATPFEGGRHQNRVDKITNC